MAETEGTGELIKHASEQLSALVRAEMRLGLAEMKDKGRHAGKGAGLFGGAGLVALFGTAALIVAVIAALDLVMPLWAAALIVAVVLLAAAGILGLTGRKQLGQAVPPMPAQTIESVEMDITKIKERAHR
jgi:hypothetical protein